MTDDGYLSRNRPYLAAMQRQRRARMVRVDYMPSKAARDAIEAMRARSRPGTPSATNSAVIDAIVAEWAKLTGIQQSQIDNPKTSASVPASCDMYACARTSTDAVNSTRAHESSDDSANRAPIRVGVSPAAPEFIAASTRAKESGSPPTGAKLARVICGAKRRRDGQACQAQSVPGRLRCKWHGGASTGPRTDEGRARSLANLRQNRRYDVGLA